MLVEKFQSTNVIGIAGGMGKDTSHKLVRSLVDQNPDLKIRYALAQQHGLVDSEVPEYIKQGLHINHFEEVVVAMTSRLADEGATHIVLACNTAHQHEQAIRDSLPEGVQFLSIVDAVKSEVKKHEVSQLLILATSSTTFRLGLFDSISNLVKPSLDEQNLIDSIIIRILNDQVTDEDVDKLIEVALNHGSDGFLFACTDLAMIKDRFKKKLATLNNTSIVIESTEALANSILSSSVSEQ